MKKSDQLKQQLNQTDNDFNAFNLDIKIIREEKFEKFEIDWLPKFKALVGANKIEYIETMYCWRFYDFGGMDYYPKANKIFIKESNKWIKPGLKYLINKYFK